MNALKKIFCFFLVFSLIGCDNILDLSPKDKLTAEEIFSNPEGVRTYMANLYGQLPVEDFTYFRQGFHFNAGGPNNGGFAPAMQTDEAVHSEFGSFIGDNDFEWWEPGYRLIRDVNTLRNSIPELDITESLRNQLVGESAFILAYSYFTLARRYGGVPLIDSEQEYVPDVEALQVPRSTEQETWEFVLELCDIAIDYLPDSWSGGDKRATRWVAYALKSRAALHAASIAKFGDKAPLSGTAVDNGLIGLDENLANSFYQQSIDASDAIINSNQFSLFRPNPTTPEEAAENYRVLFDDPNSDNPEVIFIRGYAIPGNNRGHNYDIWYNPAQLANGWPHPGRMNPSLDLVDVYESYDNPGESSPIITTEDGVIDNYDGFDAGQNYLKFDNPYEIFQGKDARLWGTAILPGTEWKGTEIIIQAGYVKPDGEAVIRASDQITIDGVTYYSYGAQNTSQYSGFDPHGGNNTRSGFSFKKFLVQDEPVTPGWNQSTSDWIDFRYAEIILNYAEAVIESGLGDATLATELLNDLRRRAGHTQNISLTLENVLRERRVELAFENKRYWDLIRRRDYHIEFNNRRMHSLLPLLDLRENPAQYIFVRAYTPNLNPRTFNERWYYRPIPGISSNNLIQNPQY